MLSRFRGIARSLLGMPIEERKRLENHLISRLHRLGILPETAKLDDVLDLKVEDLLERRLQTVVFRMGLAKSPYQARQLIVHGHVAVGERRVSSPSYLVLKDEEKKIAYAATSPMSTPDHPLRKIAGVTAEKTVDTLKETMEKEA